MHTQQLPVSGEPFILVLTKNGLERRPVPTVPQQGLFAKVVGSGGGRIALIDVDRPDFPPFWIASADAEDLGPAEDVKTFYPEMWKARWAGCRRLAVPFHDYWDHVREHLRKMR